MNRSEDKELWDLLGQAPTKAASPLFTQNLLNRLHEESSIKADSPLKFSPHKRIISRFSWKSLSSIAAAFVASLIVISFVEDSSRDSYMAATSSNEAYATEMESVEETALALSSMESDSDVTAVEMASCYSESFSDDEMGSLFVCY